MKIKIMKTLLSVAVLTALSNGTWAGGTTAGTAIDNTASISYSVATVPQTAIESSPSGNSTPGAGSATSFLVDRKIDLLVTTAGTENVLPNSSSNDLTYQITNEGNGTQNFSFTVSSIAGGDFDATGCTVAPATIAALAVDTPTNVVVSCNIPEIGTLSTDNGGVALAGSVANGKTSVIDLLATVTGVVADTDGDDPAVEEIVFADGTGTSTDTGGSTGGGVGDRNAKHSALGTYNVNTADLTVTKTEAVAKMSFDLDDDGATGTNGNEVDVTAGNRYHIPGATITYTITVSNAAAAATATGIVLSDTVPGTMSVVGIPQISVAGGAAANVSSGSGVNAVVSNAFDLTAGQSAVLTITARVN